MNTTLHTQRGLSLVELMISLTLGIVLMTGVIQMFLTSRVTYSTQQAISQVQESGRMAMDFISEDVRMAGYYGCTSRNPRVTYGLEASSDYLYDFTQVVSAYPSSSSLTGVNNVSEDTDILVIRRASSGSLYLVDAHNAGSNANLRVDQALESDCFLEGQLCDDSVAIISDCSQGRIFRAVNVQDSSGGGGQGLVVHSVGGSSPSNTDPQLGGQSFGEGSEIMALNSIVYFVAPSAFPSGDLEVRSLWRKVGESPAVEMVEGIERLRVRLGVDTNGDAALDTYKWREDMSAADWQSVMAVRIHLLLNSIEGNVLDEPQPVAFADVSLSGDDVADRRLRQIFTSTVGIRARLE